MNNRIRKNILGLGIASMGILMLGSCSDVLNEQPRSQYDPTFFKTENGIKGGLTSLYAHLRDTYGQAYYYNNCETGTDEYTWAQSADGNFKDADLSGVGNLTSLSCRADALWGNAFTYINTASGVIENGETAGIDEALLSEARFFRAFDYFRLVQTFGGVPLDLGAGELKFNTAPSRTSVRNTVPEVYTKAIFPDLRKAVENLPQNGRANLTGAVSKVAAQLVLAQAYLTYGWWLENPKNIPTYPECQRTDPDGHDAAWYYQQAYDVAINAIENPGNYGLMPTYYDVNLAENDHNNKEWLLYADHTEKSEEYNGGSLSYSGGSAPDNFASWMVCWNYPNMRIKTADGSGEFNPVLRAAVQALGRPWTRMAPVQEVFKKTFADKTNDSRFDGTFTYSFRANWNLGGNTATKGIGANNMEIKVGDPVLTFIDTDDNITYENGAAVGAGVTPGRADYVVGPSGISRFKYPILWKIGPYRTDNNGGLGQPNAGSTRPFCALKFSELYFAAAEAAVKGATTKAGYTARDLINVIRARAGKWRWDNNGDKEKVEDHSAEMTAATPQVITIDYILDELGREYFGEGHRWFDLVRTQSWKERAGTYTICGAGANDHTPETFTRNIPDGFYLRPIPQGQIDAMMMSDAEKEAYQNPAYRN